MRRGRIVFTILLTLTVFLSVFLFKPATASAYTSGDYTYDLIDDGIEITKYTGTAATVSIPDSLNGYTVTSIGYGAFLENKSIRNVTIPSSVHNIANSAFRDCSSLQSVTIQASITVLEDSVFDNCTSLTNVSLPDSLITIKGSFYNCSSLVRITIPDNVTMIGSLAFDNCTSLREITLPDGLEEIGSMAFSSCAFTSFEVPAGVWSIRYQAFERCNNLTSLSIPSGIKHIGYDVVQFCSNFTDIYFWGTESRWQELLNGSDFYGEDRIDSPNEVLKNATVHYNCMPAGYHTVQFSCIVNRIDMPNKQIIRNGKTVKIPDDPDCVVKTFDGINYNTFTYSFGGWYADEACTRAYSFDTPVTGDITIYAKILAQITFNANGHGTAPAAQTVRCGEKLKKPDDPHSYDAKFLGWYEHTIYGEREYDFNQTVTIPKTLYAKWAEYVDISTCTVGSISAKTYTGQAIKPAPKVTLGDETLVKGTDYTVSYKNNVNVGTATVTITGKGIYTGKTSITFTIKAKAITPTVTLSKSAYTYNGKAQKPTVTVKDGSTAVAAENYTVTYASGRTDVGTYKVTVKMKGNYSGTGSASFKINPAKVDLPTAKTGLIFNNAKQTGVAAGTNYTVTGGTATNAGTYTAKASLKDTKNYTWSDGETAAKSVKWTIGKANVKNASVAAIKDQTFTGSALKPAPVVKMTLNKKAVTLNAGTDYKVTYKNNTNPGTATVTITGQGNFTGTKSVTFKIVKVRSEFLRLAGADRYATSLAIADEYKKVLGVSKFDTVCVADGVNYPDALAGAYFAYMNNAPIIDIHQLAPIGPQSTNAINYIKQNLKKGGKVYILGGSGSVPDSIASTLMNAGFQVVRLWGPNRYTSNLAILEASGIKAGTDFIVTTGADFADALTASATGKPVLLVVGKALTAEQKAYLKTAGAKSFTIVGSTKEVSPEIEKELATYAPTTRLGAASVYDRSLAVARKYFTGTQLHINLADGRNFPDALCGGPLAAKKGGPLFLTDGTDAVNQKIQGYAKVANTVEATVYGGPASISDATCKYILSMK